MAHEEDDRAFQEEVNRTVGEAVDTLEKFGLFAPVVTMGAIPKALADELGGDGPPDEDLDITSLMEAGEKSLRERFNDGDVIVSVGLTCTLTEASMSDKVLDPESYEMNQEFRKQLPTEEEIELRAMVEDLQKDLDLDDD